MSKLSRSPLRVAREALAVAAQVLPPYAHQFSLKKFTQPQLFACLVRKTFLKTDYRGLTAHLPDHTDLRAALGLSVVPHFTTPQKASRRLLRLPVARTLFRTTVRRFLKRRRKARRAALDSTGLDCGHASRYYIRRRNGRQMKQRLDKDYGQYGQRWQAETGFSMITRRLATGPALHRPPTFFAAGRFRQGSSPTILLASMGPRPGDRG